MTNTKKAVIGVAVIAVGYFLWKRYSTMPSTKVNFMAAGCKKGEVEATVDVVVDHGTYNPETGETEGRKTKRVTKCVPAGEGMAEGVQDVSF